MPDTREVPTEQRTEVHEEVRAPLESVVTQVVLYVFGVIEVIIGLRFVLLLFGANSAAPFVEWVYRVAGIFMAPFLAVFRTERLDAAVFEWSALLAIAVYALVAWGLTQLVAAVSPRRSAGTYQRTERR